MSIKEQIKTKLRSIYHITDNFDVSELLDDIQALTNQLQEPPAVRKSPDLPELGQAFWHKVNGETRLAIVVEDRVSGLRVQDAIMGWQISLRPITEWTPVLPPKFEESGL